MFAGMDTAARRIWLVRLYNSSFVNFFVSVYVDRANCIFFFFKQKTAYEMLRSLVGSEQAEELRLPAGHIGLVVGRSAAKVTIPYMIDWWQRHSDPLEASGETVPAAARTDDE